MHADSSLSIVTVMPDNAALRTRGIDPEPVVRAAGLSPEALASIDNRLPERCVHRVREAARLFSA